MVRSEDDRSFEFAKMLDTLSPDPREYSGKRQDPQWKIDTANPVGPPRSIPGRKIDGLRCGCAMVPRWRARSKAASDPKRLAIRIIAFIDGHAESALQCHQQFNALERTEPSSSIVVSDVTFLPGAYWAMTLSTSSVEAGFAGPPVPMTHDRISRRFSLRVPSVRGRSPAVQTENATDPLMFFESRIRLPNDVRRIDAFFQDERSMHSLATVMRDPNDGGISHTGDLIKHALDVLGKDIQAVGRDDHLFLSAANGQTAEFVKTADIAGPKPSALKCLRRFSVGIQIPRSDVIAANEDLAVLRDLYLDACDRFSYAALPGVKRMIQRHNGRGFVSP